MPTLSFALFLVDRVNSEYVTIAGTDDLEACCIASGSGTSSESIVHVVADHTSSTKIQLSLSSAPARLRRARDLIEPDSSTDGDS